MLPTGSDKMSLTVLMKITPSTVFSVNSNVQKSIDRKNSPKFEIVAGHTKLDFILLTYSQSSYMVTKSRSWQHGT